MASLTPAGSMSSAVAARTASLAAGAAQLALPLPAAAARRALRRGERAGRASMRAGANVGERLFRGSLADTRLSPHTVVVDEPHCQVRRHDPAELRHATPIVFVPPLGGTPRVYDIRRGASMVQAFADAGHRVYVLDYGSLGFADRDLGLADFVDGYVARAVEVAAAESGARVLLAGWCAGGIFAALYATSRAARSRVAALALLASPLDLSRGHSLYPLATLPITDAALRLARETGLPAPVVSWMFKLTSPVKQLTKPLTLLRNLDDRDFLVHFESLSEYVDAFAAYPGAAGYELVRGLVDEDVLRGTMRIGRRRADVRTIAVPALVIAGSTDVLAPAAVVEAWTEVLRDSEYHVVQGGHLGVMAGRRAPATTWALLREFAEKVDAAAAVAATPRRPVVLPSPRPATRRARAAKRTELTTAA
jgi:polyhydroxyalkanoate synthase subunit PhaC